MLDLFTTALCEPSTWKVELTPLLKYKPDVQSYIPGDTPAVEASLNESSILIYERAI